VSLSLLVCTLLLWSSAQSDCPDVASCRQAALDARVRADFEAFHDLAWRAAQKGRPNDPDLMALLAAAQSLSGRPGDALVMLRRLAQMGIDAGASTNEDFRRVRALPGWPEVAALLDAASGGTEPAPRAPAAAAPITPAAPAAPAKAAPAEPARTRSAAANETSASVSPREEALPSALGSIHPAGLAYDAVSRRFIVGDRRQNKLVIFDDVFKRATDMVGAASGGFFGLSAIEIDPHRGDLWVANSSASGGASLQKFQLVSGRVLFALPVPAALGTTAFVDTAILPDGRVLLLDAAGRRLLAVAPVKRVFEPVAAVDVDGSTSLAAPNTQVAYVAHPKGLLRIDLAAGTARPVSRAPAGLTRIRADRGVLIAVQSHEAGDRIVRLRVDTGGRRVTQLDVLDRAATLPDPSGMTIADGIVCYIASAEGAPVMRRVKAHR
jgi:hypothetical protein